MKNVKHETIKPKKKELCKIENNNNYICISLCYRLLYKYNMFHIYLKKYVVFGDNMRINLFK